MSSSKPHHSFDIHLAESYGIECAILIHHFQHWIEINLRMKRNFHEGRTWMYDTLEEIAAHFPYWNRDKVYRIIQKLEELGVIVKGNFNKNKFDKTLWYAFVIEENFIVLQNCKIESPDLQYPNCESAICSNTHTKPHEEREFKKKTFSGPKPEKKEVVRKSFGQFVKFSDEEYSILCKKWEKDVVDGLIDEINDHCINNRPLGYDDYCAAFRTFHRNQQKKQGKTYATSNQGRINKRKTENPTGIFIDGKRVE